MVKSKATLHSSVNLCSYARRTCVKHIMYIMMEHVVGSGGRLENSGRRRVGHRYTRRFYAEASIDPQYIDPQLLYLRLLN